MDNKYKDIGNVPSLIQGGYTEPYMGICDEIEIRKFCLEQSVTILSWYKNFFPRKELTPVHLADILYKYLTTGEIVDFELPGVRNKSE